MAYKTKNPYELKKLEAERKKKKKRATIAGGAAAVIAAAIVLIIVIPKITASKSNSSDETFTADPTKSYVLMTMADGGEVTIELDPTYAPITVDNFLKLVNEGFYDGLTFHRVSPTFMIQGGDPNGDGTGGSAETIKGEFSQNGVENNISHKRGVISMARSSEMDSASSQFFIMTADSTTLDGLYAAFGQVVTGMDVVDEIASVETTALGDGTGTPVTPVFIKSIVQIYPEG